MSKRRRKRTSVKNRINGAIDNGDGLASDTPVTPKLPEVTRIPATDAAWEAGLLHEARADNCELQQKILNLEEFVITKDKVIIALRQKLHSNELSKLETARVEVDAENSKLREVHGLVVGRQLKKDPVTGDVYWLVSKSEGQK